MMYTYPITFERAAYYFRNTPWYYNYITNPYPDQEKWSRLFRLRFRMPYDAFLDLVDQCKKSSHFHKWTKCKLHKYNKQQATPIALLVRCALHYLGRAWMLDYLVEAIVVNNEKNRLFIHNFIEFGSSTLYKKYVVSPSKLEKLNNCEAEYSMAGFPGCIGSTDASHVIMETCPY